MKSTRASAGHYLLTIGERSYRADLAGVRLLSAWILSLDGVEIRRMLTKRECLETAEDWSRALDSGWIQDVATTTILGVEYSCTYLQRAREWISPAPHGGWILQPEGAFSLRLADLIGES
jgi:hypothetical protein